MYAVCHVAVVPDTVINLAIPALPREYNRSTWFVPTCVRPCITEVSIVVDIPDPGVIVVPETAQGVLLRVVPFCAEIMNLSVSNLHTAV